MFDLDPEYGPVTMPERSSEEREDGHEISVPVSAENGEENPEDPRIVNEVSKQQMVVQYLKVQSSEFLETDGLSYYRNFLTFVVLTNFLVLTFLLYFIIRITFHFTPNFKKPS